MTQIEHRAPAIIFVYIFAAVIDRCPMQPARLTSDITLDAAYDWLCQRRRRYPADADAWSFRRHWPDEKRRIQADLLAGEYSFAVLDRITLSDGSDIDLLGQCMKRISERGGWFFDHERGISLGCPHLIQ